MVGDFKWLMLYQTWTFLGHSPFNKMCLAPANPHNSRLSCRCKSIQNCKFFINRNMVLSCSVKYQNASKSAPFTFSICCLVASIRVQSWTFLGHFGQENKNGEVGFPLSPNKTRLQFFSFPLAWLSVTHGCRGPSS